MEKVQLRGMEKTRHTSAGKMFSFDLLDAEGGQMRCVAFNDAAAMFHEKIQIGKLYRIARADVSEIRDTVR